MQKCVLEMSRQNDDSTRTKLSVKSIVNRVFKDNSYKKRLRSCTESKNSSAWSSRSTNLSKRTVHVVPKPIKESSSAHINPQTDMGKSSDSLPGTSGVDRSKDQSKKAVEDGRNHERRSRSKERSNEKRRSREVCEDQERMAKKQKKVHSLSESEDEEEQSSEELKALKARLVAMERQMQNPVYQEYSGFDNEEHYDEGDDNFSLNFSEQESPIEEGECQESDDFEAILTEGADTTVKGRPLCKETKKMVEHFFDKDPAMSTISAIREKYPEPENCSNLSAKVVNPEVARGLPKAVKRRDFCLSGIQNSIAASAVANLRAIEALTELNKDKKIASKEANQLLKPISDSTKILARAYADLSIFRKVSMRSNVLPKYQQLCTKRTYGNALFGDDFSKEIKHIDEESKIMRSIARGLGFQQPYSGSNYDNQPKNYYGRGRGQFRPQFRGRRPFRGRGRAPSRQPFRGASHSQNQYQ